MFARERAYPFGRQIGKQLSHEIGYRLHCASGENHAASRVDHFSESLGGVEEHVPQGDCLVVRYREEDATVIFGVNEREQERFDQVKGGYRGVLCGYCPGGLAAFCFVSAQSPRISDGEEQIRQRRSRRTFLEGSLGLRLGKPANFPRKLALLEVRDHLHEVDLIRAAAHAGHESVPIHHFRFALSFCFTVLVKSLLAYPLETLEHGEGLTDPERMDWF